MPGKLLKTVGVVVIAAGLHSAFAVPVQAAGDTIKVGILHSLSGTMAISEATIKDALLMLIKEQNRRGGLLGRKLEPVLADPASDWPMFAEKAHELLTAEHVAVVFGCWTSVSRKAVLPVFEELNGLLFYPVQYEGEESSRNIIYTGAAPNQQTVPAVEYLMNERKVERWALIGTDYIFPRTANKIIESYLKYKGVKDEDLLITYTPFAYQDWGHIIEQVREFGSAGKKTAVISTLNGDTNVAFYEELIRKNVRAEDIPVMAFSVSEEELSSIDTTKLVGHLASWNYFQSIDSPANQEFVKAWHRWTRNDTRVTNDPMEASYIGFNLWVNAVEKAGSTDVDKVLDVIVGTETPNLSGGMARVLPNHHITKPVYIGEIQSDGQFKVVWQSPGEVDADAWSDYLPGSRDMIADWTSEVNCGSFDTVSRKCLDSPP